jgi:hypothetical protein
MRGDWSIPGALVADLHVAEKTGLDGAFSSQKTPHCPVGMIEMCRKLEGTLGPMI